MHEVCKRKGLLNHQHATHMGPNKMSRCPAVTSMPMPCRGCARSEGCPRVVFHTLGPCHAWASLRDKAVPRQRHPRVQRCHTRIPPCHGRAKPRVGVMALRLTRSSGAPGAGHASLGLGHDIRLVPWNT
ncbi:hypothetical protein HAX54_040899 [Datura stramonium]|uniref:Uncharacterized protein n=1 Tax=Datura stramonium TaxID=4076 RepID=A0ABS8VT82_DATST|nr:hypothetical protein [Datura stramonium]